MKTLLWIVLAIVAIIAILGFLAPKNYNVNRSIEINKPVNEVYTYLTSLKKQDDWSPWAGKDPEMKKEFVGADGTVGCISKWDSEMDEVGAGEQEITKLVPNERIEMELRFLKPYESESLGYINTKSVGNGTEVTWGFSGENQFPMSIMMLFMDMDKMVGPDFEQGLSKLKTILESTPAIQESPASTEMETDSIAEVTTPI